MTDTREPRSGTGGRGRKRESRSGNGEKVRKDERTDGGRHGDYVGDRRPDKGSSPRPEKPETTPITTSVVSTSRSPGDLRSRRKNPTPTMTTA